MRWRLKECLEQTGFTPYALAKASGITQRTVYSIVNNKATGVDFKTVDRLLAALEQLSGRRFELDELFELRSV